MPCDAQSWTELTKQEANEFTPFRGHITAQDITHAVKVAEQAQRQAGWVRAIITGNRVFHSDFRHADDPNSGNRAVLYLLLKTMCLTPGMFPDADMVFNPADEAIVNTNTYAAGRPPPIWSWTKDPSLNADLWFPYHYSALALSPQHERVWSRPAWEDLKSTLFWRGSATGLGNRLTDRMVHGTDDKWRLTARYQLVRQCMRLAVDAPDLKNACDAGFISYAKGTSSRARSEAPLRARANNSEVLTHK